MKKYLLPIFIICLLCTVLAAGFTLMSIKLVNIQQANVHAQQALLLENLRAPVHNALQSARLGAENLAASFLARQVLIPCPSPDSTEMQVQNIQSLQKLSMFFPYVELLVIVDRNNIPCLSSYPLAAGTKIVDDRHVQQSLRGMRVFSSPYMSPVTGSMAIAATSPIAHNDTIVGVAVAIINMQKLGGGTTNRFELDNKGYVALMDNSGTLILHPDFSMLGRNISQTALGQQLLAKESGHTYGTLFGAETRWVAFTSLPRTNWKLLLSMPYTEYMRPVTLLRDTSLLAGLFTMILVIVGVGWLAMTLIGRMEKARLAAAASIQAKDNFLANMSHEIRTPMNGIIGLSHLLGKTSLTAQQADYLRKIQFSSNSLLHLISDILDISKISANKLRIEKMTFRLTNLLEHVQSTLQPQANAKGLQLKYSVQPEVPLFLTTDPYRLGQILLNLVGNGLKFTEKGSVCIKVSLLADALAPEQTAEHYRLAFAVSDSGIGIAPHAMDKLFQPFSQADTSITRKFGGTGLGLVICKHLAEMLNGTITVTSQVGLGSTFTCTITCKGHNQAQGQETELESSLFTFKGESFALPAARAPAAPTATAPHAPAPAKPKASPAPVCRVLLVEDNDINQQIAEELLCSMGAQVTVAANGIAAVECAAHQTFDIIFMDIQMPEMDGITATKILREQGLHLPIIAMTAHAMSGDEEKSFAAGMNEHITKPICPDTLRKALHNHCPQCFPGDADAPQNV